MSGHHHQPPLAVITTGRQPLLARAVEGQSQPLWLVSPERPEVQAGVAFEWVRVHPDRGFAEAANAALLGASERGHAALLLLNDDAVLLPGARAHLAAEVMRPGVAAAGAVLLEEDGRTLQSAGLEVALGGGRVAARRPRRAPTGGAVGVPAVAATAIALRVAPVLGLGGFNGLRFPFYFEDVDLCLRLRKAAWRVVLVPQARAVHRGAATAGRHTPFATYQQARGQVVLSRGHSRTAAALASALSAATLLHPAGTPRGERARALLRGLVDGWVEPIC